VVRAPFSIEGGSEAMAVWLRREQAVEALMRLIEATRRGEAYTGRTNVVLPSEAIPGRNLAEPRRAPLLVT